MPVIFLSFRPVISASLGEAGSSVTMGALLCMLMVCAWPVQLTVPAGWQSGGGAAGGCVSGVPGRACRPNTVLAANRVSQPTGC